LIFLASNNTNVLESSTNIIMIIKKKLWSHPICGLPVNLLPHLCCYLWMIFSKQRPCSRVFIVRSSHTTSLHCVRYTSLVIFANKRHYLKKWNTQCALSR